MNSPDFDKHLLQILEDGPLGLATVNADLHFLSVNQTLCRMLAVTAAELTPLPLSDIVHREDYAAMNRLARQLFDRQIPAYSLEQRWRKKDGSLLWVHLTVTAVCDDDSAPCYGVVVIENITSQKQAEAKLEYLAQRLAQTERLTTIGRLTSTLTHEINNSMHVVQGLLNLSLEELDNPLDLTSYLNMSLSEASKIIQLIGRLRYSYFAQSEPVETFELPPLLEEAATLATRELKRRHISVHVQPVPELPALTSQPSRLYLVLLSSILNLGEMMASGGGNNLDIRVYSLPQSIMIAMSGSAEDEDVAFAREGWQQALEMELRFSFHRDTVADLGGELAIETEEENITYTLEIPVSKL